MTFDDHKSGVVGRFVEGNRVVGWVWAVESEYPKIRFYFDGNIVGEGVADKPRKFRSSTQGYLKIGFNLKLTYPLCSRDVQSEGFKGFVVNRLGVELELEKSNDLLNSDAKVNRGLSSEVSVRVGGESPDGAVMIGHEGFLFLVGGSNNVLTLYENSDREAGERWLKLLEQRSILGQENGFQFLQIFIAEKVTALKEFFPLDVSVPSATFKNLRNAVDGKWVERDVLFFGDDDSHISMREVFRKTDSHLTSKGAEYLFRLTVGKLDFSIPSYEIGKVESAINRWDLGEKFKCIEIVEENQFFKEIRINESISKPVKVREVISDSGHVNSVRVYRNDNAPIKKTVVAFANSFFWAGGTSLGQAWWFSHFFQEFHFYWSPKIDDTYLKSVAPDVVVCQSIERFMRRVPER